MPHRSSKSSAATTFLGEKVLSGLANQSYCLVSKLLTVCAKRPCKAGHCLVKGLAISCSWRTPWELYRLDVF